MKPKVKLKGNKKVGWVIEVSDNEGYKWDMQVTHEELVLLNKLIKLKI